MKPILKIRQLVSQMVTMVMFPIPHLCWETFRLLSGHRLAIEAAVLTFKGESLFCTRQARLGLSRLFLLRQSAFAVNRGPARGGWGEGWSARLKQLGRRLPRASAPAHGAEGTGSGSEMAASMFYSRLLAAAALRSRGSRPALWAAAQVLRPSRLSLGGPAGGRARWETWRLWARCEGI